VVLDLDPGRLAPYAERVAAAAPELAPVALELVLTGGEDHGLLATFPADVAARGLPEGFREIGHVVATGPDLPAGSVTVDGRQPDVGPGWDHFGS
jgi:thiamine-monophosphate kinase